MWFFKTSQKNLLEVFFPVYSGHNRSTKGETGQQRQGMRRKKQSYQRGYSARSVNPEYIA